MKSFIAILLASLFLLQSAEKFFIVVNYEMNKADITKKFCENKAKPMMHCNGKCHLKKQLQKQDKKENSPANNIKDKFEVQYFSENKTKIPFLNITQKNKLSTFYLLNDYNNHLETIFQPPRG